MAWDDAFNNRTELHSSSSTQALADDDSNPLYGSIIGAMLTEADVAKTIQQYYAMGGVTQSTKYFNYGTDTFGVIMPSSKLPAYNLMQAAVQTVIQTLALTNVELVKARLGLADLEHALQMYRQDVRIVDLDTGFVTFQPTEAELKFYDYRDNDLHSAALEFESVGLFPADYKVPPLSPYTYIGISTKPAGIWYKYTGDQNVITAANQWIPYTGTTVLAFEPVSVTLPSEWVYEAIWAAEGESTTDPTNFMYWRYTKGTGTYPTLDTIPATAITNSGYYPIVCLFHLNDRLAFTAPQFNAGTGSYFPLTSEQEVENTKYTHNKRLLKYLGMDYSDVTDALFKGAYTDRDNDHRMSTYVCFAVPFDAGVFAVTPKAKMRVKPLINYAIEYLTLVNQNSIYTEATHNSNTSQNAPVNTYEINSDTFILTVAYRYIKITTVTGVIAPTGDCTFVADVAARYWEYTGKGPNEYTEWGSNKSYHQTSTDAQGNTVSKIRSYDGEYWKVWEEEGDLITLSSDTQNKKTTVKSKSHHVTDLGLNQEDRVVDLYQTYTYRRQDTETTYTEVVLAGLRLTHHVYSDSWGDVGSKLQEQPIMCIPMLRETLLACPFKDREIVVRSSTRYIFNSFVREHISFAASSFWTAVMVIITIIAFIPSGGTSVTWSSLFTAAFLWTATQWVLVQYIRYLIYREIVRGIVRTMGLEVAFLISLMFMAYGKISKWGGLPGSAWAQNFMNVGSYIWRSTNTAMKHQMQDVQRDFRKQVTESELLTKELEEAKKLLDPESGADQIDPWLFVNPPSDVVWGQPADQYMAERVEVMNPGLAVLEAPKYFVKVMLSLPTADESLNNRTQV